MPIKGLTDRGLSFPEIGSIRKGIKVTKTRDDGTQYQVPKDLDYFRVTFDEREHLSRQKFLMVYGPEPKEINIILPFDEIERVWDPWLEAYTAGRMIARSDGERFWFLVDTETRDIIVRNGEPFMAYEEDKPVGNDENGNPIYAKPVGRLKVIIPELVRTAFLTVHTTSLHDIDNISQQLQAFKYINNGVIKGIPLVLRRRPKQISIPFKDGRRTRMEKWLLSIEADPAWVKAKLAEVQNLALPDDQLTGLLPGDEIDGQILDVPETWIEQDFEGKMDLDRANIITTKEGIPYGEIDSDILSMMWGTIQAKINESVIYDDAGRPAAHMDPDELDELTIKRDAINTILMARGEQQPAEVEAKKSEAQ